MRSPLLINPTEEAWLAARRNYLTATEVPSILGTNPYKSGNKVLYEKKHGSSFKGNPATAYGQLLEPAAIAKGEELENSKNLYAKSFYVLPIPKISSSPDAVLENNTLIEAKCPSWDKKLYWKDNPPLYYLAQCQVQLMTTEAKSALLLALFVKSSPDFMYIGYRVTPCLKIFEIIEEETARFWDCYDNDKEFRSSPKVKIEVSNLLIKQMNKEHEGMSEGTKLSDTDKSIIKQVVMQEVLNLKIATKKVVSEGFLDDVQEWYKFILSMIHQEGSGHRDFVIPLQKAFKIAMEMEIQNSKKEKRKLDTHTIKYRTIENVRYFLTN